MTPLLKNAIDWVSRVRGVREPPLAAYRNRVFALGAASEGPFGGMRSLMTLRQILELGCGALVLPDQIAVPHVDQAFDEMDHFSDAATASQLRHVAQSLVDMARNL